MTHNVLGEARDPTLGLVEVGQQIGQHQWTHESVGAQILEAAGRVEVEDVAGGDLDVTTARASDYFGPRGTSQSPFGDQVIGRVLAGKSAQVIGDPDQPHSYTYTVDAARTLAALGTRQDVSGEIFHVPNAPALTTRQIIDQIGEQLGRPIKTSVAPRLLLRVMGLFNPTLRELDEMLYEFTQPFIVDSSKAQAALGIGPTPLGEALDATVTWFRDRTGS